MIALGIVMIFVFTITYFLSLAWLVRKDQGWVAQHGPRPWDDDQD